MRGALIVSAALLATGATGNADDKKPATKTLAEEAQLLSKKEGWVSDEITLTLSGGKKEKGRVTVRFVVGKDKSLGTVMSGVAFGDAMVEVGLKDTFELVEKDGERKIMITRPDFMEATSLAYSLDGDTLVIKSGVSFNWAGAGVSFKDTKFTPIKPKK